MMAPNNDDSSSLVIFERGAQLLAQANTIQTARELKALALTAAEFARQMKLGDEAIRAAKAYALEAERKMGQMLKEGKECGEIETPGGDHRSASAREAGRITLANLGLSDKESHNAQKLAGLSDAKFADVKAGKLSRSAAMGKKRQNQAPPKEHYRQPEVAVLYDQGLTDSQIGAKLGLSATTVRQVVDQERIKRGAQAIITPDMLSMTARQKLELAIKQHKQRLAAEWQVAVRARVDELLLNSIGPRLKKEQDEARRVMERRKGIMDRKAYRIIASCLHPDRVTDEKLKPLYARAFDLFNAVKILLLDEKNDPTDFVHIPTTLAEWDALKREATLMRKAKRTNGKGDIERRR